MKRLWLLFALGLVVQAPLGCGDDHDDGDDHDHEHEEGEAGALSTGAVCDDSLTYAGDIKPLMDQYCTRCHSSKIAGAARMGAPADHNFDTEAGIHEMVHHIDEQAGSGPDGTNTTMPPSNPKPTTAEREMLSKFLACHL
ncbi:MAG TPA: hypothetical protein VMF89_20860 [Polyangiales bacterium]|nr:hypothetical protein [Polyangiales bacterium]